MTVLQILAMSMIVCLLPYSVAPSCYFFYQRMIQVVVQVMYQVLIQAVQQTVI